MKYTLVAAHANRDPHRGLMVKAYYKQDPSNPFEVPQSMVVFNRWPPVEMEAEVTEYKLDGIYEYPNGKRTREIRTFSPKNQDDTYVKGMSPQELISKRLCVLVKVGE